MKRIIAALLLWASPVLAQKPLNPAIDSMFPEKPSAYLTDLAHAVPDSARVNATLRTIRNSSKLGIMAITFPTIGRFDVADVARDIGRKWKVALANDTITATTRNTGAVIVLVMDTHKCRIETATGTEGYLTDGTAGQLCRDAAPLFKAGKFDDGIIQMATGIQARHVAAMVATTATSSDTSTGLWVWFICGLIVAGIGGFFWFRRQWRIEAELDRKMEEERQEQRLRDQQAARYNATLDALNSKPAPLAHRTPSPRPSTPVNRPEPYTPPIIVTRTDDDDNRRNTSYSSPSYDPPSSPSPSYDPPSTGGSDSFSGGGGGSDW